MKAYILTAAALLTLMAQTFLVADDKMKAKKKGGSSDTLKELKIDDVKGKDAKKPTAIDPSQDFVFLAESRPLLIRVHCRINGKALPAAFDEFAAYLFGVIDLDKNGTLSEAELDRAPSIDQIVSGSPNSFGGFRSSKVSKSPVSSSLFKELDTNKDGKVDLAEFSAFLREAFTPFRFEVAAERNMNNFYIMQGKIEPTVDVVSSATFALLDANRDGKITREELLAAPEAFRRLDTNEDEMVTAREIAPNYRPPSRNGMMMSMGGNSVNSMKLDDRMVLLVTQRGEAPNGLVSLMQSRYAPKKRQSATQLGEFIDMGLQSAGLAKPEGPKNKSEVLLSRLDLGLDQETFAALDANGDGKLNAKELAGFVKRTPDIELIVRLGTRAGEDRMQVLAQKGKATAVADKLKAQPDMVFLDLGTTRAELRGHDGTQTSERVLSLMRQQYSQIFKQADREGKGYLEEKEVQNYFGRESFKAMDRDGDGKVTEKELLAYLDLLTDLQKKANQACAALVLSNESRGLFDLLDANRDGKLSVREVRGAVKLLDMLDTAGKGYITRADVPSSYRLTVKRGGNNGNDNNRFIEIYGGDDDYDDQEGAGAGPAWFRKMDRNRDGDVSRNEWLGSEELFRRIDTDGDGLISLQEAERYDAEQRALRERR